MSESELVTVETNNVLAAFIRPEGLDPLVAEARQLVASFDHDMTTAAGRKKTASLAAKVSKFKTHLDALGKDLVSDWKNKAKVVDGSRKKMRDELDVLKAEARRPLTDWEDEQARVEQERADAEEAEEAKVQKESDHEFALLMDDKIENDIKNAAAQKKLDEEQRDIERQHEAETKAQTAVAVKLADETRQREAAERRQQDAEDDAERLRNQAGVAAENARLAEVQRQEDAAEAERQETARRAANKEHAREINQEIVSALMPLILDTAVAEMVVTAIVKGEVPHVSIKY